MKTMKEQAVMDPKEVLTVAEAISIEKQVPLETVFEAIESALAEATRRSYEDMNKSSISVRIAVDRKTGNYKTFRTWTVCDPELIEDAEDGEDGEKSDSDSVSAGQEAPAEGSASAEQEAPAEGSASAEQEADIHAEAAEVFDPELHLRPDDDRAAGLEVGGVYEESMNNMKFGRIAAQHARQVIVRRVRDAERAQVREEYQGRLGELLNGTIERVMRDGYILKLSDNVDAYLPRAGTIGDEHFHSGDTVRGILEKLEPENRGPQLVLSRTIPAMVMELFRLEVPEVAEGVIEIRTVAREPGSRAKIAVKTNDGRIDPVSVCVGMRGSRVLAVSEQLNGERVDIVQWDDSPAQMVINALAPAEVESVVLDEENLVIEAVVREEGLPQAVGVRGENVRLASKVIGWRIDIMSVEQAAEKRESESSRSATTLAWKLDVDTAVGEQLVAAGLTALEDIALKPVEALTALEGVDESLAAAIQEKANDILLMQELGDTEEIREEEKAASGLLQLEGMDKDLMQALAERGILTVENLAEQAVDDLLGIAGMDEEKAGFLIMAAREPWFAEQSQENTDS